MMRMHPCFDDMCMRYVLMLYIIMCIGISDTIPKVPLQHPCVKKYIEDIKSWYLRVPIMKEDPWPPPPCKDYVDLVYANFSEDNIFFGDGLPNVFHQQNIGQFKMLIRGMPGVGKTTVCKRIAQEWARGKILQNYDIVLLVQLRDLRMTAAKCWEDFFCHDESSIKEKVLKYVGQKSGSCVLFIFDGFDELSKKDRCRGSLFSDIFNQQKLQQSSVIITTRPYATQNLEQRDIYHIEIIGFDEDKVKTCIKKSIQDEAQAKQLIMRVFEDDNLKKLCAIPNNLAIVIYIFIQENGKLPNTLTELYRKFITNTLDRNAQELKPKKWKKYLQCLEQLAYNGLTEDKLTFNVNDMDIEEGSTLGLMTASETYNSSGHKIAYNFLHLTIQEYLAACWIASNLTDKQQIDFIKSNYHNSRFYQTIIFLAGVTKMQNEHFFRALSLLFEKALTDLYIHVTNEHHLNDINGRNKSFVYRDDHLKSFLMLISILHERGEASIDSNYFSPELSDHVLLLNLIHLPHSYYQSWLVTFVTKSNVCWDRLEMIFDRRKSYDQLRDLFNNLSCKVRQLGLHDFSLLNCGTLLDRSSFDDLEYLRVDSVLYHREITVENMDETVWWGADFHPKKSEKLKYLLEMGTLKHLLLHHITLLEAEYIIEQSVTPYLAKCTSLQTLCLHFERNVSSDLLINLFKGIEMNSSIETLNLSIGFDTLAIESPTNILFLMLNGITADIVIHKKERQNIVNAIKKIITRNKTIKNLSITRTESIRDNIFHWADDKTNFMPALISAPKITRLTISCNLLYMPLLGDLLKYNKTITSLTLTEVDSMYKNECSKGVFVYLVAGLKDNSTLKRLILNSSEWYVHVPQGSKTYPKCSSFVFDLSVYMDGISNATIDSNIHLFHLLNAIKNHPSLEELVFDYYSVVQRKRISFTATEKQSEHITEFCSFSDKNQKALCNLLQHNKCLRSLTISGFNFKIEQLQQVSHALVLNGHQQSFNIMLTEMLSEDNLVKKKDVFEFEDIPDDQPQSDLIQSLAMFSQSIHQLKQSKESETQQEVNKDSEKTSLDSDPIYGYDKIDNNGDIIQEEVDTFKEVMFRAMVTVLAYVLSIRQTRQKFFLDTYIK